MNYAWACEALIIVRLVKPGMLHRTYQTTSDCSRGMIS